MSAEHGTAPWAPPAPPPPPPPPSRTRPRGRAAVAAAVAALLVVGVAAGVAVARLTAGRTAVGSGSSGSAAGVAPAGAAAVYHQALAAVGVSAGFHYIATSTGAATQTIVGVAGRDGGRQVITVASNFGSEQFTLLLVSGTVYFQGNVAALEDQLGVPAAGAAKLVAGWVSVSPQDGPYGVIQPGITVADQAQELEFVPVSLARVTTAEGVAVTRILGTLPAQQGTSAATVHLDVVPTTHLPVAYMSTATVAGVAVSSTTSFSGWGTAPSLSAPSGAVAWSTLGAVPPPGGYGSGGGPSPSPSPQGTQ